MASRHAAALGVKLTALVTCVEFQHRFFVGVAEHLPSETEDAGSLADARSAADDHMGHVAVLCNDLEALDGLRVADDVVEVNRAVLFYPGRP
jgi:hypothetical protein